MSDRSDEDPEVRDASEDGSSGPDAPAPIPAGSARQLFDPGLQVERTFLSWRRTCLSFAAGGLVAMRFTVPTVGLPAVVIGLLVAGAAVLAYIGAAHRYHREQTVLVARDSLHRSGLPMLLATGIVLLLGALCVVYLVTGVLRAT
ncbi:YidH family protein [Brachybacterium hainanense]|uniref:YidH family protein n=1 Tax=Brachybacterium hainanense TaxID=1541174 RepID=A0ABV6RCC9_9MICO